MKGVAQTIGVRELRRNASRYLALVKEGQRIAITDRGELVAYLEPVTTLERLVAAGQVRMPTGNILDHLATGERVPAEPGEKPLSKVLQEMRDEERY